MLVDVPVDLQIMQEEIFGPILPVLEIDSVEKVIDWVNERPDPLALTSSARTSVVESILERTSSGTRASTTRPPPAGAAAAVGGVGNSGMGKYHGHRGFEAFTNARGVLYHSPLIDPGVRTRRTASTSSSARS